MTFVSPFIPQQFINFYCMTWKLGELKAQNVSGKMWKKVLKALMPRLLVSRAQRKAFQICGTKTRVNSCSFGMII